MLEDDGAHVEVVYDGLVRAQRVEELQLGAPDLDEVQGVDPVQDGLVIQVLELQPVVVPPHVDEVIRSELKVHGPGE